MQYVKLDLGGRSYTYAWAGEKEGCGHPPERVSSGGLVWPITCDACRALNAGEWVRIPGNAVNPREARARVLRVLSGPDYDGPITEILGRYVEFACPARHRLPHAEFGDDPSGHCGCGDCSGCPICSNYEDLI